MELSSLSKNQLFQFFMAWVVLITVSASITIPYYDYYFRQASQSTVMGDFNVLGFGISGDIDLDYAVGRHFVFIGNHFNVSIPCEGSYINSLEVMKDNEQNSALFDTVIYNVSGKLDIILTDIDYIFYQTVEESSTAVLSSHNQYLSGALMSSGSLQPVLVLDSNTENTNIATISAENPSSIFLGFGAHNGSLSVIGDVNASFPIISGYIGIMLNLSTPLNRSYHARIDGDFSQIYIEKWETIKFVFMRTTEERNTLSAYSPKGSLSYNDKEYQAKGSQDLDFENIYGVVYLNPSNDPYFFRMITNGDVDSILLKTTGSSLNLTEKDSIAPIFPYPILGVSIGLFFIFQKITKKLEFNLLPVVVLFFVVSIVWSIKTEQPLWLQNLFGYAPLFVTVIIFLLKSQHNNKHGK